MRTVDEFVTRTQKAQRRAAADRAALLAAVDRRDGVAPMHALHAEGHTRRTLDRARADGSLIQVRKGWVATPTADAHLVAAATHRVVVTCVTQAQRLGLFVLAEEAVAHVAAPAHSGRTSRVRAHVHWAKPVVPRHPDQLVDPIENVLSLVAGCLPREDALVIWESALRQSPIELPALRRLPLPPAARSILADAGIYSDSGLVTLVAPRLRWLRLPLRPQIWIAGHRVDLLIGERLVLQIDGAHHVGLQREQDIAHDALLALMGYHVIRVGYTQVIDGWAGVQDLIMRAVAQGLHQEK